MEKTASWLRRVISLSFLVFVGVSGTLDFEEHIYVNRTACVEITLPNNNGTAICRLKHPGHSNFTESWIVTSLTNITVGFTYDHPGEHLVEVECLNGTSTIGSGETIISVIETITGLSIEERKSPNGTYIISTDSNTNKAMLKFKVETGGPLNVTAKLDNETIDASLTQTNTESKTGVIILSQIGNFQLEITIQNDVSSERLQGEITVEEPIDGFWSSETQSGLLNRSVLLNAQVKSGSNVQYEFCVTDDCENTGTSNGLNYTFLHVGLSNFTVYASNKVSEVNETFQIKIVHPIKGFQLKPSAYSLSTSDDLTLTLTAPESHYYPMEDTVVVFLRNESMFTNPKLLTLNPTESETVVGTLIPPGIIHFKTMLVAQMSSMNISKVVRVGDPIEAQLTISGEIWESNRLFEAKLTNVRGWAFDYTFSFGDNNLYKSSPGVYQKQYNDSLSFNHTYLNEGTYTIEFHAMNAARKQAIVQTVSILHAIPSFSVLTEPYVSIPDGWATFTLLPKTDEVVPTRASCVIYYGNNTRTVKDVDWTTGFPASFNYKFTGMYQVQINCSNLVSEQSATVTVYVGERDVEIKGLNVHLPEYVFMGSRFNIDISIEAGSNVQYRVKLGSSSYREITDQRLAFSWILSHSFNRSGQFRVDVIAYNSVSETEASVSIKVVKNLTDFTFSVTPSIVSSSENIQLTVKTPQDNKFPFGPLVIDFYRKSELIASKSISFPEPNAAINVTVSRWKAGLYPLQAVISSPIARLELQETLKVENPIPFFNVIVDKLVTIPDGVVSYQIETRADETPPTNANCILEYGDGEAERISWDFNLYFNHTFLSTGLYNTSFSCLNRVSKRHAYEQFDVCEFTADGFRFTYPRHVPLNSSSPNVNVRFKYNICGLTTVNSDSQISWLFTPHSSIVVEPTVDWEEEHLFWNRGYYNIKVFIKSLETDTETTVDLPLTIGLLKLQTQRSIGRINIDDFTLIVSGMFGNRVYFRVNFGDGMNVTANRTNLHSLEEIIFSHRYKRAGLFYPSVLAWSEDFVEEIKHDTPFQVLTTVQDFDLEFEQESPQLPAPVSMTIHLQQQDSSITCQFDNGVGETENISFNQDVVKYNSFRTVNIYESPGPFNIQVNCSNLVSFKLLKGTIELVANFSIRVSSDPLSFEVPLLLIFLFFVFFGI